MPLGYTANGFLISTPDAPRGSLKRNGPEASEIEIIGLEFTMRHPDESRVEELAMFSTPGLIIPRVRTGPTYGAYGQYQARITFHSTDGDFTIESYAPW